MLTAWIDQIEPIRIGKYDEFATETARLYTRFAVNHKIWTWQQTTKMSSKQDDDFLISHFAFSFITSFFINFL